MKGIMLRRDRITYARQQPQGCGGCVSRVNYLVGRYTVRRRDQCDY
jgi:hypothetical protein